MKTVSSAEAQKHFRELLDNVQRESVTTSRRGRPVSPILSRDMEELTAVRERCVRALAELDKLLTDIDANFTAAAKTLNEEDMQRRVDSFR